MQQARIRPRVIAGNWKMYKTIQEAILFVETLAALLKKSQAEVYLAVPFTAIQPTVKKVDELGLDLRIGAQNMNDASEGAFTGEIAAKMLKEAGASFVILGHSERRQIFGENDAFINRKVKKAFLEGIQPILCVGETLEERDNHETHAVLERQINECLDGVAVEQIASMIVAYEPVWAIGTGIVAEAEDAEKAHQFCRHFISDRWGDLVAQKVVIQYGGSVNPENAGQLLAEPNIDGLLVGGASLKADIFVKIINCAG